MTRSEVLSLVKHLVQGAKEDIKQNTGNLMIGRRPYRCLGCNQTFVDGINGTIAPKVNHDALPSSGALAPAVTPYARIEGGFRNRQTKLRPLTTHRMSRPRSTGKMGILRRSPCLENPRSLRNRSR